MDIIIVGCGKIGKTLTQSLVEEGHSVTVIDISSTVIDSIANIYDVMGVCGSGTDGEVLEEAGVSSCGMFVAVTRSDELNMLSCFIAKKMGAQHTIARIRNPEYNMKNHTFLREQLELSMAINPEMLAAREMFNILKLPSAVKIEAFSRRNFEIIELIIPENSILCDKSLVELRSKLKGKFLVCVVQRGEQVIVPNGNFVIQAGDRIGLTASPDEIQKFLRSASFDKKQAKNIMLLGGSRIAYYLARLLAVWGNSVKIVEQNPDTCAELSESLPKTVLINGDGTQQELLLEEGLDRLDAFISLTGTDEENILMSIFAHTHKVPTVITKLNRDELTDLALKLGLDRIISVRKTVSDVLVRYARAIENSKGSNVETLYKIMDDKAEALEFNVSPDFTGIGTPLKELSLRPNILIAGITRSRNAIIPTGDDVILHGDKVIVLSAGQRLNDLEDILK